MKILRLSPYYVPERISSTHLTDDLEAAYANAGFQTELYVPTPTRGISDEERKKYKKIKYEERYNGQLVVHRFSMFREGRNPFGRALRYILVNLIQYHKGCRAKDVTVVMGGSTPPTQGVLCAKVAQKLSKKYKRHVPFIFNLQDMFPESLVNTGMCKESSILCKIGNKISDYTYRHADRIRVISDSMKEALIKKGVPAEKITVIYNWIDTDATVPVARENNPLFDELELDRDKFYVTYAGTIGNIQNVDILVDCARLLQSYKDIRFVVFGAGVDKNKFEKQITDNHLSNIQLFPLQPIKRASYVYSLGDASFVPCKKGVSIGVFPSKTVTILSAGTPVIASYDLESDLCRIITENEAGLCADAEDLQGAVDAILTLYNDRDLCRRLGENARALACSQFSKKLGTSAYITLLKPCNNN